MTEQDNIEVDIAQRRKLYEITTRELKGRAWIPIWWADGDEIWDGGVVRGHIEKRLDGRVQYVIKDVNGTSRVGFCASRDEAIVETGRILDEMAKRAA